MATAQGEEHSLGDNHNSRFPNTRNQIFSKSTYDDDDDDYEVTCGGGERPLGEKLPDGFEVKSPRGPTWNLTGAIELHRLVVEDYDQLERRASELKAELINSTCTYESSKEVSHSPLSFSPGDATVARLLLQSVGLGALAPEQGRRSQQGGEME